MELEVRLELTGEFGKLWTDFNDSMLSGNPYHTVEFLNWWNGLDADTDTFGNFMIREGGKVQFIAHVYSRHESNGKLVCEVPHGPIAESETVLLEGIRLLRAAIPKQYPLFIAPYIPRSESLNEQLEAMGFKKTGRKWLDATVIIDLTKDDDEIFHSFSPMARRAIRSAERNGYHVTMEHGEAVSDQFLDLHNNLAQDRGFGKVHPGYLHRICDQEYGPDSRGGLFVLRNGEGQMMAAACMLWTKQCLWYHRGASVKGVPAKTQFLHWKMMQWAKARRIDRYDFGGINLMDPNNCTVTRFKLTMAIGGVPTYMMPQYKSGQE